MAEAVFVRDAILAGSFIRHVEIHDELGSTNDRAAELASNVDLRLPALITAKVQMAGRGRGHHTWWSSSGSLTFSVIVHPATMGIPAADWPRLSLATGVAVCDALQLELDEKQALIEPERRGAARVAIKWPNDVILDGAKVAGILIESRGAGVAKDRLTIGIGINVNNSWRSAPRDAGPDGIALCDATFRNHDLQSILLRVLNALNLRLQQLAANDAGLPAAWSQLCWLTEQQVEVQNNREWIDGVCLGIAEDGALLVENVYGTHRIISGSVRAL
jgi:BirA family biotin operon repressor/biotin-[acetyl-CoA-carboxylase] ligase